MDGGDSPWHHGPRRRREDGPHCNRLHPQWLACSFLRVPSPVTLLVGLPLRLVHRQAPYALACGVLLRLTSCALTSTCPPRSAGTACEVSSRGPARHGRRSGAAGKHPTPAASAWPPLGLWLVLQVRAQELVMQQQGLGGRAAGPNGLPWRPDIPSRSACEEGDSSTLLAVGPGRRSRCCRRRE